MSTEGAGADPSRLTNETNSVNSSDARISDSEETEIPSVSEKVAEFKREYPERAGLRLTARHGVDLRRDLVEEHVEEWSHDPEDEFEDRVAGERITRREPLTWSAAVEAVLESHRETQQTTINLERGREGEPQYAEWSVSADDRWSEDYQSEKFAEMKAWFRELTGGERPSGGETDGAYEEPYIALVNLTASATPDGEQIPPADHMAERADAWESTYHALRNEMRSLGYELGDGWQYDRRQEPHDGKRGGGDNWCYGHDHVPVVVDGEVSADDLRPVVEKWVEECDFAGATAHDLDVEDWNENADEVDPVEVRPADEVDDVAKYVADYCGIQPEGLFERSLEYIAWAGLKHATNSRAVSRSMAANHATTADRCKQRAESPQADQTREHGERIQPAADGARHEYECAECGSPWEIDQSHETLSAARLAARDDGATGEAAADGGVADREAELRERWPSARAAATYGERPARRRCRERVEEMLDREPDAGKESVVGRIFDEVDLPPEEVVAVYEEVVAGVDRSEVVGFKRPPEWRVESVEVGDEEYPATDGGGVDMVATRLPVRQLLDETQLGRADGDRIYWRCEMTGVAIWGGEEMAEYLVGIDVEEPEVVDEIVTAVRGPGGDGVGSVKLAEMD